MLQHQNHFTVPEPSLGVRGRGLVLETQFFPSRGVIPSQPTVATALTVPSKTLIHPLFKYTVIRRLHGLYQVPRFYSVDRNLLVLRQSNFSYVLEPLQYCNQKHVVFKKVTFLGMIEGKIDTGRQQLTYFSYKELEYRKDHRQ